MGFLKHLCGILFAAALILMVGGFVWYLLLYSGQRDYAGGMLVRLADMARGMV